MYKNPHPSGCPWHIYAEIFGAPDIKYCEETLCQIISEPANTWSNLVMILAGLWGVYLSLRSENPWLKSLSLSAVAVGLLSFLYHLSNNFLTQYLDFLGMYFFVALILLLGMAKKKWIPAQKVTSYYLLGIGLFSMAVFFFRSLQVPIQPSVALIAFPAIFFELATLSQRKEMRRRIIWSLAFFALAGVSQVLDITRFFCDSGNHYFQLHMMWHVFNGLGIGSYLYYCAGFAASDYHMEKKL